jgi:ISXO2-like transposase domain
LTLVEREGSARSFHINSTTLNEISKIVLDNVKQETIINTDEGVWYKQLGAHFLSHDTVNHSREEYARGDITTNTVEGYYSIFKRGMKGIYQHCSEKHPHRYLAEFDFRYSNRASLGISDAMRAEKAMKGIVGKPLTYRRPLKELH